MKIIIDIKHFSSACYIFPLFGQRKRKKFQYKYNTNINIYTNLINTKYLNKEKVKFVTSFKQLKKIIIHHRHHILLSRRIKYIFSSFRSAGKVYFPIFI